jgi:membrane protein implicated in regulation of membrane protease activity
MLRQSSVKGGFPAGNPIANVLVIIAGALVIGASIVLGFFAFLVLGAVVLVSAAVVGLRVWWLKRKMAKGGTTPGQAEMRGRGVDVIEGEFRVVGKDRDET